MGRKIALLLALLAVSSVPAFASADKKPVKAAPAHAEKAEKQAPAGETSTRAEAVPPAETGPRTSSGLPIPRYVSLSGDKVFVRTGPALRYPIKWVYQRSHMPVEVIGEFDTWRKIRDIDGDDGWVHQSMLSGARNGIIKGEVNQPLRKLAEGNGRVIAYLEPNVNVVIDSCKAAWCEVEAQGYTGFIERKFLWGIYDSEDFD